MSYTKRMTDRYYTDRTFLLLSACCLAAVFLSLLGKIDSGTVLGILTVAITGWCGKRGIEEFKKAEVIAAESSIPPESQLASIKHDLESYKDTIKRVAINWASPIYKTEEKPMRKDKKVKTQAKGKVAKQSQAVPTQTPNKKYYAKNVSASDKAARGKGK